jgi:hypothetical protein
LVGPFRFEKLNIDPCEWELKGSKLHQHLDWSAGSVRYVRQRLEAKSEPGSGSDRPEIQSEITAEYSKTDSVELNVWPVATAIRF